MEHWAWLPMIACILMMLLWITACTMVTSRSNSLQPAAPDFPLPRTTITIFERNDVPSTVTRRNIVRAAAVISPEPSPTPTRYIIKADDTLLDIALRYDVTLNALLEANPEVDPLVLQIGQEIVIPLADDTSAVTTSVDLPLVALPVSPPTCYSTATSGTVCLGLVKNDQPVAVEQVVVDVQLLDETEALLGERAVTVEQAYISPGNAAPYRALFPDDVADDVAMVAVELIGAMPSDTILDRYATLELRNQQLTPAGERYHFEAEAVNNTDDTVSAPRAVITLTDESEQVFGYRVWNASQPLDPGGFERIEVSILPLEAMTTAPIYMLHVEAQTLSR